MDVLEAFLVEVLIKVPSVFSLAGNEVLQVKPYPLTVTGAKPEHFHLFLKTSISEYSTSAPLTPRFQQFLAGRAVIFLP